MAFLTKQQILDANDLPRELVPVPEWGGEVYVRALTALEMLRLYDAASQDGAAGEETDQRLFAKLVAATLADENGSLVFTEDEVRKLSEKSSKVLTRLTQVAQRLNGIGESEVKAIEKN